MQLNGHTIGVCSWSLQPTGMDDLIAKVKELGLEDIQLSLAEPLALEESQRKSEVAKLRAAGVRFTGGMMHFKGEDYSSIDAIRQTGGFVPDDDWPMRRRQMGEAARLAKELGIQTLMTHVGFVPHKGQPMHEEIVDRVREVAALLDGQGVDLLMETGQESAAELLDFLYEVGVANVHLNFDPANMILYGAGDPIEAIRLLGPHIRHVHVKDATASAQPGVEWGAEVPLGTGLVNPSSFLRALKEVGYTGPLAIEREAGNSRMADVETAVNAIRNARV